jgi:hypothetical protein
MVPVVASALDVSEQPGRRLLDVTVDSVREQTMLLRKTGENEQSFRRESYSQNG